MAVTSTNNLRKGSKGDDVLELQKLLNNNGYNLAEDGSFGGKTLAAVQDYQQKNGLKVDGVVGTNTWGALTKAQAAAPAAPAEVPKFEYEAYKPSDTVTQAEALLQQQLASKPGEYQSAWQAQLNDTLQKILNREKFSYDLNGDMLYQQYKDQYTTQGKLAMMDTMGQAAAMTGGYGNSYAQTAGQQAYQGYLQQLNDKVPELYQLALNQYNAEGDDMYNQASLMAQMENQDYGRYRDTVSDYYTELDRLTNDARYQSETDYGRWSDDRNFSYGQFSDDRTYDYQVERDKIADQQWQATFDEGVRQYNASLAENKRQYNLSRQDKQKEEEEAAKIKPTPTSKTDEFIAQMVKDTQYWDAIARHQYGSEKTYIAQQLENSSLTEGEKAVVISRFGITDNDLNYKKGHS